MIQPGATPNENEVLKCLRRAWNCYQLLPERHASEPKEFEFFIHGAQNIILSAIALREIKS